VNRIKRYFSKLPYPIKYIIVNIYSFILVKKRYTKGFLRALEYYKSIDYTQEFKFNERRFLAQIEDNSFYKKAKDIESYPIINKSYIKSNYSKILNREYLYSYIYTSGTTGSGFKYPVSKEFIEHQWAIFWKFRYIHNLSLDSWCIYISGQVLFDTESKKPPFWIKSYPLKQLIFSQYHLNSKSVKLYLEQMINSKISWLHAYPSVLSNFANLILEEDLVSEVKRLKLEVITTSSERLTKTQRELIERVFNTKVRELYGLSEGVANIFECEYGTLHIDEEFSYVELIPKEDSKDEYQIVGTTYYNRAFPLVRYNTQDSCILYSKDFKCKCKRRARAIKEILGRDEDYLLLADGTKIGRLDHIFKALSEVKEAQIIQYIEGEAIFRVVKGKDYTKESELRLIKEIKHKLGDSFRYKIEYVSSIQRSSRGKLKFVINEIKR